ncbi:MAG: hypothetical protein LBI26_02670 [Holosporales bacterium]|jgi:hypothetical protein|nr:hypothetical protein [Holosporales bacterium]
MFNTTKFLDDSQQVHLNPTENSIFSSISDEDVRKMLDKIIDIDIDTSLDSAKHGKLTNSEADKVIFRKVLDDICRNIVGNTMFKILKTKKKMNKKRNTKKYIL